MDMLNIPATSKARVVTTMKAIIDAHEAKKEYDPSAAIKAGRGAKVLIEDYTPQAGTQRDGERHEPGQHGGGAEPVAPKEDTGAHQLRVHAALRS